jgi:nucleoid-associated protein YgaU
MLKRNLILFVGILFLAVISAGCLRVTTIEQERVDLDVIGNQGYILGSSAEAPRVPEDKTRKIIQIDVDFSDFQRYGPPGEEPKKEIRIEEPEEARLEEEPAIRKPSELERGYIQPIEKPEPARFKAEFVEEDVRVAKEAERPVTYTYYTVKEDENLWDIAGRPEVYGDSTKWTLIYEANKDKIAKPDLIKAGMELKIPRRDR